MQVVDDVYCGIENEYALNLAKRSDDGKWIDEAGVLAAQMGMFVPGEFTNYWDENGSRFYVDIGSHPEYATPESMTGQQAEIYARVGELMMLLRLATLPCAGNPLWRYRLTKNNLESGGNTYGAHESYTLPRQMSFTYIDDVITAFLVTRQLLSGAGWIDGNGKFQLAQRSHLTVDLMNEDTTKNRPIINMRDQPHADPEHFRRLHLILGDANLLFEPAWLKIEITRLVLLLARHGALRGLQLVDPVRDIQYLSINRSWRLELARGGTMPATEVQAAYLAQAEKFVIKHDLTYLRPVIDLWRLHLQLASGDWRAGIGRLDWATKLALVEKRVAVEKDPKKRLAEARAACLDYHTLCGGSDVAWSLRGKTDPSWLSDEVAKGMTQPPSGTRAAMRGDLLGKLRRTRPYKLHVDWHFVFCEIDDNVKFNHSMPDPGAVDSADYQKLLVRLRKLRLLK